MMDAGLTKKIKINLSDYDYQKDIENRLIMAHFSTFDVEVLEEILFNPLKIPISKLIKNLQTSLDLLQPTLDKLSRLGLFIIENEILNVDKEMRKYYEFQVAKFDDDFKVDMEFLQSLLRKVPIHVLPIWYSIPRTSNNIFQSIIDKYLLTPQLYQRYLQELKDKDPIFSGIIHDIMQSPNSKIRSSILCEKYHLTREDFEEYMLILEFSFACCLSYTKEDDHWIEVVTPFYEWRSYLNFLKKTEYESTVVSAEIQLLRSNDFAFIEDISAFLELCKNQSISSIDSLVELLRLPSKEYVKHLILKLSLIRFIEHNGECWVYQKNADEWMKMSLEHKALHLYRHPLNQLLTYDKDPSIYTERNQREAEKSIQRVLHGKWVLFEKFLEGVTVPIGDHLKVQLSCQGKQWKYQIPNYSSDEIKLIYSAIFEGLFEAGIVKIGALDGKEYFSVTSFGRSLFEF